MTERPKVNRPIIRTERKSFSVPRIQDGPLNPRMRTDRRTEAIGFRMHNSDQDDDDAGTAKR